jgi:hypothetical protein
MAEPRKTPRTDAAFSEEHHDAVSEFFAMVDFARALEIETQELVEALRKLTDQLRLIHKDDNYLAVWIVAQSHLGRYSGPYYVTELEAAEQALARHRAKQEVNQWLTPRSQTPSQSTSPARVCLSMCGSP